jgi:hypothetical protein
VQGWEGVSMPRVDFLSLFELAGLGLGLTG